MLKRIDRLSREFGVPFIYLWAADVLRICGIGSASELYRLIRAGSFPPGELLSPKRRRWRSDQISQYLLEQSRLAEAERDDRETLRRWISCFRHATAPRRTRATCSIGVFTRRARMRTCGR